MAMVDVVSQLPTGVLMAQVGRLGPKVGSHLALLCIHRMNRVNSHNDLGHDDSTMKIVVGIIIIIIISFLAVNCSTLITKNLPNIKHVATLLCEHYYSITDVNNLRGSVVMYLRCHCASEVLTYWRYISQNIIVHVFENFRTLLDSRLCKCLGKDIHLYGTAV